MFSEIHAMGKRQRHETGGRKHEKISLVSNHWSLAMRHAIALKMCKLLLTASVCLCLFLPYESAASCFDWPVLWAKNESRFHKGSDKRVLILPFVNAGTDKSADWLDQGFRFGLQSVLGFAKNAQLITANATPTFETAAALEQGQKAGADYVIAGQFRLEAEHLLTYVQFIDVKRGGAAQLMEEKSEWPNPQKFSELLIYLARRASKSFSQLKLEKKAAAYLAVHSRSLKATQLWSQAMQQAVGGNEAGLHEAYEQFKTAIKDDFNFCHGYLGVALTGAQRGFMERLHGIPHRETYQEVQRELTKTALLCPELTEAWRDRIMQYLEADIAHAAGATALQAGDAAKARSHFAEAVQILPGDILSLRGLVSTGGGNAEVQATLSALAQCP